MVAEPLAEAAPRRVGPPRPLKFDLVGKVFKADPYPTFAAMREAGPVIRLRFPIFGPIWFTTTHASTLALVKDNARFVREGRNAGTTGAGGAPWFLPAMFKPLLSNMLLKDEPDHRRLRKLVDRAFQRRDIQAMRGRIEAMADRLIDGMKGEAEVDLVDRFARRLPLEVICELLGLPEQDRDRFSQWASGFGSVKGVMSALPAIWGLRKLIAYLRGQIEESRRHPRPGLIGELVKAEEDGDRLNADELLAMVIILLIAGFETTTHLIGDSVLMLETHAEQKAWLLADSDGRMERAVEELARFTSPVETTKAIYIATSGDFFGAQLRRGEKIIAGIAAANADPAVFGDPERLRLDRFPNPHLVFSSGIHFCLGMQLARVEAQSALGRLYARCPDLALAGSGEPDWTARIGMRSLKSLKVNPGRVLSS
jgi:cytochrome P450